MIFFFTTPLHLTAKCHWPTAAAAAAAATITHTLVGLVMLNVVFLMERVVLRWHFPQPNASNCLMRLELIEAAPGLKGCIV